MVCPLFFSIIQHFTNFIVASFFFIELADVCYYRTSNGVEMDFVVTLRGKIYAVECKTSTAPSLQKGTYNAIEDINPNNVYVVAPIDSSYSINENIQIVTIPDLIENIKQSMQI